MIDANKLRALDADATRGPWVPQVYPHPGHPDTVCVKAGGEEIINWMGFDGVPCTKKQIRANAKLLATLRNAVPDILALTEEVRVLREALADPNSVHVNMLRGDIALPSVAQIIHIYGEDKLRAALSNKDEPA